MLDLNVPAGRYSYERPILRIELLQLEAAVHTTYHVGLKGFLCSVRPTAARQAEGVGDIDQTLPRHRIH